MSDFFMKREGLRRIYCAEAIIRQHREDFGVDDHLDEASRSWAKGKAPDGHCGALYAARRLLVDAGRADEIPGLDQAFDQQAGSADCRAIRKVRVASCARCVEIADEYLRDCAGSDAAASGD